MALPVPNLDDRRFQDLVDEAKRLVQQRCPEWTDHNVSDPGVTLIETFAWMTEQVIYRLNRVPDRLYVKFLELIGVRLFPPTAALAPMTFWLTAPPEAAVVIPADTRTSTVRTETDDATVFTTVEPLTIVPTALQGVATEAAGSGTRVDTTDALQRTSSFPAFQRVPVAGDALLIALTEAVPSGIVRLRFQCQIKGVGVDPDDPPLAWEAWDGQRWQACEIDSDGTGGLNRDGDVILHVPSGHAVAVFGQTRAGWLRGRVTELADGQPGFEATPTIHGLSAVTLGGTVDAINADLVLDEGLGASEGVPGQRFSLLRRPVLAGAGTAVVESGLEDGWVEWTEVSDFATSTDADRHFVLDSVNGEVLLGPAVRAADGSTRVHGAVPAKGTQLRLRSYATGGGRRGNVSRGAISVLKSSIPYIARVENRRQATGGVDGEDIENAKVRGPMTLRTRWRAVTTEDFEVLSREAAPEIARVRCLAAGEGLDAGSVRVLIVPAAPSVAGRIRFEDLVPSERLLEAVTTRLDECRLVGTRVLVEPPRYRGVTVVARLVARPRANPGRIETAALDALFAFLNPISGGPDGEGWPFGRPVQAGEIFAVLQAIAGVELIEDVRIFGADPLTGQRGSTTQRLEVAPNELVFSYGHQVRVGAR